MIFSINVIYFKDCAIYCLVLDLGKDRGNVICDAMFSCKEHFLSSLNKRNYPTPMFF